MDSTARDSRGVGCGFPERGSPGCADAALYLHSDYCITPYVAARSDRPTFVPDPVEVAEVLEVPVLTLLDPAIRREEECVLHGITTHVPFYQIGEHKVWGATAMVLSEFVAMLGGQ